ncbi:MAG: hypothetical protein ACT6RL_19920 [Neoaquamicrobium sediminum]|uniref:hypothetical protein n=1 Tax=Neoaquamicrobium sediminum TaxID=1849104 RepID=UPI004036A984
MLDINYLVTAALTAVGFVSAIPPRQMPGYLKSLWLESRQTREEHLIHSDIGDDIRPARRRV